MPQHVVISPLFEVGHNPTGFSALQSYINAQSALGYSLLLFFRSFTKLDQKYAFVILSDGNIQPDSWPVGSVVSMAQFEISVNTQGLNQLQNWIQSYSGSYPCVFHEMELTQLDNGYVWATAIISNSAGDPENQVQNMSVDGAITVKDGVVLVTKTGTKCAMTLTLPTPGPQYLNGDDGKTLRIVPIVANAHTITTDVNGFNGNKHILTLVPPSSGLVVASNGIWYLVTNNSGTLS
jgi:hypothetical protein